MHTGSRHDRHAVGTRNLPKRGPDLDRDDNWDVWLVDARQGAKAHQLTTYDGADSPAVPEWDLRPAFSPDGKMPAGAPDFILKVLQTYNNNVKGKTIDLSKTWTNEYVDAAK